jgi:hypothetical protein
VRLPALSIVGACLSVLATLQLQAPVAEAEVYRIALAAMQFEPLGSTSRKHALIAAPFDPGVMWRGLSEAAIKNAPYLDPKRRLTYAKPETVESFLAAIETQRPVPPDIGRLAAFLLVDERQARAVTARDGWRAFERRHALAPGIVSVSRIGFDRSGSQALLYVSFVCGLLCGHDDFVLLERGDAGWHVVKIDGYSES